MNIFYLPELSGKSTVTLDQEESKHLSRVLRLEKGDKVLLTNGLGLMLEARVKDPSAKGAVLEITEEITGFQPRNYSIHIAVAPTKNIDRIEWFVEKSVELGIEEISFIKTQRSERKNINLERLNKIAVSAMKQSIKPYLPALHDLTDFNKFLKAAGTEEKFIAHLENSNTPQLHKAAASGKKYLVLIGPEGDFSDTEITAAKEAGFKVAALGPYRLRTETAALTACTILNFINQA